MPSVLITQRSQVKSRPRYQEMQVRGLIARRRSGLFDHPLTVRWRDLVSEHGTSRPGPAGIGIAAGVRRSGAGSGTGGGMLSPVRATPSRAGGTVVIPGSPSGFELHDRGRGQLGPVIGPARRPGWAGPGPAVSTRRLLPPGSRRHVVGHQVRRNHCRPSRRAGWGPSCVVRPWYLWRLRNAHDLPEM